MAVDEPGRQLMRRGASTGRLSRMNVASTVHQLLAMSAQLEAAGLLRTLGHAVLGVLAAVFVVGGLIGFFIGKAFGGRS